MNEAAYYVYEVSESELHAHALVLLVECTVSRGLSKPTKTAGSGRSRNRAEALIVINSLRGSRLKTQGLLHY